eukprot:CCRYP_018334-RB/>CCRYP_018334-RB protein AED:0.28 eAED:0.28 QI:0/0/0/1/0/0/2/0/291
MQPALSNMSGTRVKLNKGVHHALEDFRWMHDNIASRPTRTAELVPLDPAAEGHHDASGSGVGGIWFPSATLVSRSGYHSPGGLLHLEALTQAFDVTERTVLSKGDNLSTTFWEQKGSTSSDKPPAYLLRLFGIHQHFHRYVPRFDYISGASNHIADALSHDFHLTWPELIDSLSPHLPQNVGYQLWTPSPPILSAVTSALLRKQSKRESLLVMPPKPSLPGLSGPTSQLSWASTPFSKPSKTKYQCYKSSPSEFVSENLQPKAIPSGLGRLKLTYGTLHRRSSTWGPKIHG